MGLAEDIADRLLGLPEGTAIALRIQVDNYFDVIRAVLDIFAPRKDLDCIYISTSIPAQSIVNALQALEIDMGRVSFVDSISQMMMSSPKKDQKVLFVESPSMLETIMLKVEYLMKKRGEGQNSVVFLDSINSLAIHNNNRILSEFLHVMVNNFRAKNAYTVILSVEEHGSAEIANMINLVCDETIVLEKK
jgi:KaiC/GvpD/RAD55 family RecA-like ATPase